MDWKLLGKRELSITGSTGNLIGIKDGAKTLAKGGENRLVSESVDKAPLLISNPVATETVGWAGLGGGEMNFI